MWPDLAQTRELASVIDVLSAMITPAVLLLATGSLVMTTSNRSMRCVDRVRERATELEELGDKQDEHTDVKRAHLYKQLEVNTRRARLLQKALSRLYLAVGFFVATSVGIGVVALLHVSVGYVPLVLGFFGAFLLFSASVYLILESRLALTTTYTEMDYISRNYMR
jgi:Protein of unknown function (DUF2721)